MAKQPGKRGGLGIKSLPHFNEALLGVQLQRFNTEQEQLWRRVAMTKYRFESVGSITHQSKETLGTGAWRRIVRGWHHAWENTTIILGDKGQIHFWHVVWCAGETLCSLFPNVNNVAREKHALIKKE